MNKRREENKLAHKDSLPSSKCIILFYILKIKIHGKWCQRASVRGRMSLKQAVSGHLPTPPLLQGGGGGGGHANARGGEGEYAKWADRFT